MKKYQDLLKGYHLVLQISATLLCSVFGSLGVGIWLDRRLNTAPWLMFILMVLGIALGTYTVYRTVKESE